jgi:excisionase family DNA binding protein
MSIQSTDASYEAGVAMRPLAVTVRRACDITGLGNTSIYELIKEGRLQTRKIGRRTLVLYSSLEALVA